MQAKKQEKMSESLLINITLYLVKGQAKLI